MNSFLQAVAVTLTMITFLVVLISMMTFFSINPANYPTYICWIIALTIFYNILPTKYQHF